ncbi:MAG TPA: zinc ribbon domain-containing protein [Blastocatellia bacterium]|nr:zinc ribbon domain-containing protein [Blastocatellia bacterium]
MYCSSCGAAVPAGSTYCNRCGTDLKPKQSGSTKLSETMPESLIWAIAAVTIVGLGVVIGMMAVMKEVLHFETPLIVAFTLLSFLTFIGVDAVFISVLLRSRVGARELFEKNFSTKGLDERNVRSLPEPGITVTEHTTRTLDHVESDRKTG